MDTSDIVWLVVAILVVLAVIALLVAMMRKRKEKKAESDRLHAQQLRREAATHAGGIAQSQVQARESEARAMRARLEAERAEAEAAEAQQALDMEQAKREDRLREADRIDPSVDTTAKDYQPGRTSLDGPTDPDPGDGSTRVR
jgi:uncharacterized protein HemX